VKTNSSRLALPLFNPNDYALPFFSDLISIELIHRYKIVPLALEHTVLHLGIADPDQTILDLLQFHTGFKIHPVLMNENTLNDLMENYRNTPVAPVFELTLPSDFLTEEEFVTVKENQVNYQEPLIKFVDEIIQHAIQKNASDIHIEPFNNLCRIRFRRDGILYQIAEIPSHFAARLITRLKVMARMDISERRLPQDGRFQLPQSQATPIDIRMNTCPTVAGEKVALRILDANKISLAIHSLGFNPMQEKIFRETISSPQGMILVTGPTGSGKTVTLYSALSHLNTADKNISSVEDPVEIQLPGINQVNINPKIGLDFATVLRTFLRQDPDILMIGEIRDAETADIAIQAAQTGHLVLSTLHTNSAIETLTRLQTMGIKPHQFSDSISLILSQRLVRKLCNHCKQQETLTMAFLPKGCDQCLYGYQGRTGIYEILVINDEIIKRYLKGDKSTLIAAQLGHHYFPLREAGLEKVQQGITSLAEINRIIKP
jgi:type IV pilus assembly protein PilB